MGGHPLYLKQLELGPMQNFVYLIGDPETHEAAVVDPGWEPAHILSTLETDGYRLTKAFVTHHHFDHVMGLGELLKHADIPIYAHKDDAPFLKLERGTLQRVSGGETILVGNLPVTLIHTPGHTPGSQCLLVDGNLLTGDTLFIRACGRWDLPGGDPAMLYDSLVNKLKRLDDATIVHPGHNYADALTSTIGDEKRHNPFMQPETREQFLKLIRHP